MTQVNKGWKDLAIGLALILFGVLALVVEMLFFK